MGDMSCLCLLVVLAVCEAAAKAKSIPIGRGSSGGSSISKPKGSKGKDKGSCGITTTTTPVCNTGIAEVPNCPDLTAPGNSELKIKVKAKLYCDDGYFLDGTSELTCENGSDWNPEALGFCQKLLPGQGTGGSGGSGASGSTANIPDQDPYTVSVPECSALVVPDNGRIEIKAEALLRCNSGYTGENFITCGPSTVNPDWNWELGNCTTVTTL